MGSKTYSTDLMRPKESLDYWNQIVCETYFQLSTLSKQSSSIPFTGKLSTKQIGPITISTLESSALKYNRNRYNVGKENEDYFLITMPEVAPIHFSQNGREVKCMPGEIIIEGSADPYIFEYEQPNRLTVVKIPGNILRDKIYNIDNLCATNLTEKVGSSAIFKDYLASVKRQLENISTDLSLVVSTQIVDLLVIALDTKTKTIPCADKPVQKIHIHRAQHYINMNLANSKLSPHMIAESCSISLRYLHQVFEHTGWSVAGWIKERRLEECFNALSNPNNFNVPIAQLAYRWGFSDQAHFNRSFKSRFNMIPSAARPKVNS